MEDSRFALIGTDWGIAAAVATGRGLKALVWPQASDRLACRKASGLAAGARRVAPARLPRGVARRLAGYFAGRAVDFCDVPLDLSGLPPFHAKVLAALRRIGYGRTISYGQLARRVGRPAAARAVGQALAHNPIPVIVPCHRVLRGDGRLGGFSADGGVTLKKRLLEMERRGIAVRE